MYRHVLNQALHVAYLERLAAAHALPHEVEESDVARGYEARERAVVVGALYEIECRVGYVPEIV